MINYLYIINLIVASYIPLCPGFGICHTGVDKQTNLNKTHKIYL